MAQQPDVAVVCTLPLQRGPWLARAASTSCGDFARRFAADRFDGDVDRAWSAFAPEAAFVTARLALFESWGALVLREAGAADLREAAARRRDVVVIAHWKDHGVAPDDVRDPERAWREARALGFAVPAPAGGRRPEAAALAAMLDAQVGAALRWTPEDRPTTDSMLAVAASRERLNAVDGIACGNRVEMWDGMLSGADFATLLGHDRLKTLYLAICTSNYLLEWVRRSTPATICLAGRDTARVDLVMLKLTAALTLCRLQKTPLWRALAQAGELFDQVARQR